VHPVPWSPQVAKSSQGEVQVIVGITNSSDSAFHFSQEDLQLYLNSVRIEPTLEEADAPHEAAPGSNLTRFIFSTPVQFDPHSTGLLLISRDPRSEGFTASDGPVPTESS
jgi:hypothetical protein